MAVARVVLRLSTHVCVQNHCLLALGACAICHVSYDCAFSLPAKPVQFGSHRVGRHIASPGWSLGWQTHWRPQQVKGGSLLPAHWVLYRLEGRTAVTSTPPDPLVPGATGL